jgi:hypothetical protein
MRNDIFAAVVAQRLNIALPRTRWLHLSLLWQCMIYDSFHQMVKKL